MYKLKKCCVCWTLDAGAVIIGNFMCIASMLALYHQYYYNGVSNKFIVINGLNIHIESTIDIICSGVIILTSIILMIGALKKNRYLLLPWMVIVFTFIVTDLILLLCTFIFPEQFSINRKNIALYSILNVISCYFWYCICSLYVNLKNNLREDYNYFLTSGPKNDDILT